MSNIFHCVIDSSVSIKQFIPDHPKKLVKVHHNSVQ
jgi:hypothetical protein